MLDKIELLRVAFPTADCRVYGIVMRATDASKTLRIFSVQDNGNGPEIKDETLIVARACELRKTKRSEIVVRGVNFCPVNHVAEAIAGKLGYKHLAATKL